MASLARKLFVGGNWKCNQTLQQTKDLVGTVINQLKYNENKVGL